MANEIKVPKFIPAMINHGLQKIDLKEAFNVLDDMSYPLRRLMCCYECALMEVETKFRVLNEEFSLKFDRNPIEEIKTRIKEMNSIMEKLQRRKLPISLDSIEQNLNDVAGIRVICTFPSDVYKLADALTKQDDITLIERKDYILNPKENGYRSLHLIVSVPIFLLNEKKNMKVEIQIRTIAMNFWAALEHQIRYKKDNLDIDQEEIARELKECAEISSQLDNRMESIKNKIETNNASKSSL